MDTDITLAFMVFFMAMAVIGWLLAVLLQRQARLWERRARITGVERLAALEEMLGARIIEWRDPPQGMSFSRAKERAFLAECLSADLATVNYRELEAENAASTERLTALEQASVSWDETYDQPWRKLCKKRLGLDVAVVVRAGILQLLRERDALQDTLAALKARLAALEQAAEPFQTAGLHWLTDPLSEAADEHRPHPHYDTTVGDYRRIARLKER